MVLFGREDGKKKDENLSQTGGGVNFIKVATLGFSILGSKL